MTEDTNIIEMAEVLPQDAVKQAEEIIAKAREEQLARLNAANAEITETCQKYNVALQGIPIVNNGGTKIPIKMDIGGLPMQVEIQLADLGLKS